LCDRVAIIDRGQLLALGTVGELKTSLQQDQVTHFEGAISAQAESSLHKIPEVLQTSRSTQDGKALLTVVSAAGQSNLPRLIETLTHQGAVLQKITTQEPTLEDVFVAKTGRTLAEDTSVK
jgi:ABC-2 type transport system ATP-binding protein